MLRGLFFQAWGSLTSLKSQTRDSQLKVPPIGLGLMIFTSWKNPSTSTGFETANLGSRGEHDTPRPPRPTFSIISMIPIVQESGWWCEKKIFKTWSSRNEYYNLYILNNWCNTLLCNIPQECFDPNNLMKRC